VVLIEINVLPLNPTNLGGTVGIVETPDNPELLWHSRISNQSGKIVDLEDWHFALEDALATRFVLEDGAIQTVEIFRLSPSEFLTEMQPFEKTDQFSELLPTAFIGVLALSVVARRSLPPIQEQVTAGVDAQRCERLIGMTLKKLPNLPMPVVVCGFF
jgi:hypothetical protein